MPTPRHLVSSALVTCALATQLIAQDSPGEVESHLKLGTWQGGLDVELPADGRFGEDVALVGDLDGDGLPELAVGAPKDPGSGPWRGAVWILFLDEDGSVRAWQRIAGGEGGFPDVIADWDQFGAEVAETGDLDGDGVPDLAVGAPFHDDEGLDRGAFWLLLLNPDGTVKDHVKHSGGEGGFGGILHDGDRFGEGLATLGDLDGDGTLELAVGAPSDDAAGNHAGAVWIVSLDDSLAITAWTRVAEGEGGLLADQQDFDFIGGTLEPLGDLDGDGVPDLAIGHPNAGEGFTSHGGVWILFLQPDGSVREHVEILPGQSGFGASLGYVDLMGSGLACPGDVDGDGIQDLVAGAPFDDDGAPLGGSQANSRGALWVLFLQTDGTVRAHQKISEEHGNLQALLLNGESLGYSVASLGDLDGDGTPDLATGMPGAMLGFAQPVTGGAMVLTLHAAEWVDLGGGLAQHGAAPSLSGHGTLVGDAPLGLELRGAPATAPAWLVAGGEGLMLPFLGGLLGPSPDVVFVAGATDAGGRLSLDGHWPGDLPPATSAWFQVWLPGDGGSPEWVSTNTLLGTSP
jgi:hypothetical protein